MTAGRNTCGARPATACGHPIPAHHEAPYWHNGPDFYCSAECMGRGMHVFGRTFIHELRGPDYSDYLAESVCSCGEVVQGQCASPVSAAQHLATNKYNHRHANRAAFGVVAEVLV